MILLVGTFFVSAQPPFESNDLSNDGLQIFFPPYEILPQNTGLDVHVHVTNISNGARFTNDQYNCTLNLHNSTGGNILETNLLNDPNGIEKIKFIHASNFSDEGHHSIYIFCNTSTLGGSRSDTFIVTESGVAMDEGRSLLSIGLLIILLLFLFVSIYSMSQVEDYRGKFALYWVSHVLLILTFFAGWQLGVEGLLSGTSLVAVFKTVFYISTIAVFPMLLLSLAWIFYIHTMNDHFKKLIDKGEDPETAFNIAQKKSKRRRW